jgi:hypothetical protein
MNIKQTYGLQLKTYLIDLILNWQSEGREKISVSEITDHFIERQKKKVTFQERENLKRRKVRAPDTAMVLAAPLMAIPV